MKLSSIMTTEMVTISPDDPLDHAIALFDKHQFRHLPVVRRGALVSLLSRRDVSLATGWLSADDRKRRGDRDGVTDVSDIMRDRVITLSPEHELEAAASMMVGKRAGAIPLLEESLLVGLVTATDLLGAIRKRNPLAEWGRHPEAEAKVSDYMQAKPATLSPRGEVAEAAGICKTKDLRHLAITEEGEIVGLVSEHELRYEFEEHELEGDQPLSAVMVTDLITIGPDEDLAAAADTMIENGVSALPVVDDRELVGLLTNSDVIQHFTAKYRLPPIQ
jgi:CBS domain-containing protein